LGNLPVMTLDEGAVYAGWAYRVETGALERMPTLEVPLA
jgi:hypothetical protein